MLGMDQVNPPAVCQGEPGGGERTCIQQLVCGGASTPGGNVTAALRVLKLPGERSLAFVSVGSDQTRASRSVIRC